jgi:presequence protease
MAAKSAQMEPQEAMINQIYHNLFADHMYSNPPKGAASEIVTLTYQEVIAYYSTYYHPSNGQAFCYGQQEYITSCLEALEPALGDYEANDAIRKHSEVDWMDMTQLDTEKKLVAYPSYSEDVDYRAVVAWVLNDQPMDLRTEVAWHLIHHLLVGTNTSPIAKAIVDLDLGDDVIGYFENGLQQWVMAFGVSGIPSEDKVSIAREAVMGKLSSIVSSGFSSETLAAALNKMEFKVSDVWVTKSNEMPMSL